MARLYRPHVPMKVRIAVAERQVTELSRLAAPARPGWARLYWLLEVVAQKAGCDVSELRLDHDPPLAARPRHRRGLNPKTFYMPDANDPDHLFYRPHGPQHERSHLIKTNVRGDHGQHPDRVLIKKARRIERGPKPKRGPKIRSRGFIKSTNISAAKMKSRPFNRRKT
jgi:hypothetical protein